MKWLAENYMLVVWLAVVLAAVITEASTMSLVSIWFIPAAVVALVLELVGVPFYVQIPVFIVVAAVTLLFSKRIAKRALKVEDVATNADAAIGAKVVVIEKIDNIHGTGTVKLGGQVWTARSASDACYEAGDVVNVISIEGVKLICNK